MINIRRAITKKLGILYPNVKVYTDKLEQGMKKPCFFVFIRPVIADSISKLQESNTLLIEIVYFPKDEYKSQDDWLSICSLFKREFRVIRAIDFSYLTRNHRGSEGDGFRYLMDIDYIEILKDTTKYPDMGDVNVSVIKDIQIKEGDK
ncbi:phage tail terminator family protein [Bacillus massiliigorillae]|uniref:phage tail terminator family protein n=1 Tax=Bacillus massiliigorillae TaxID=1243664 RepID=UPI0003A07158|nr:hypothetical protein [Bacillus massiliigorillae]